MSDRARRYDPNLLRPNYSRILPPATQSLRRRLYFQTFYLQSPRRPLCLSLGVKSFGSLFFHDRRTRRRQIYELGEEDGRGQQIAWRVEYARCGSPRSRAARFHAALWVQTDCLAFHSPAN